MQGGWIPNRNPEPAANHAAFLLPRVRGNVPVSQGQTSRAGEGNDLAPFPAERNPPREHVPPAVTNPWREGFRRLARRQVQQQTSESGSHVVNSSPRRTAPRRWRRQQGGQPPRRRDFPLSPAACSQPRGLDAVGPGSLQESEGRGQAHLLVRRVLDLPLVRRSYGEGVWGVGCLPRLMGRRRDIRGPWCAGCRIPVRTVKHCPLQVCSSQNSSGVFDVEATSKEPAPKTAVLLLEFGGPLG